MLSYADYDISEAISCDQLFVQPSDKLLDVNSNDMPPTHP